jgi:CelD/BcsL family acetyltransferase involved in cellulose biosynthesis
MTRRDQMDMPTQITANRTQTPCTQTGEIMAVQDLTDAVVAAPARREIHAAWISSTEEFAQLAPEWRELLASSGLENVFLTFEWMSTWWRHFGRGGKLAVIAIRAGDKLVGIAPFYVKLRFGLVRCLAFLADDHVGSDHLDLLAAPGREDAVVAGVASMLQARRRAFDYIELAEVGKESLAASLCARFVAAGMTCDEASAAICPRTPLPSSFKEYLSRNLSQNVRHNFNRRWKILQEAGNAEFVELAEPASVETGFSELLRLHSLRFDERAENSAFLKPGIPEFNRDAMRALAAQGRVRIYLLKVNGKSVAARYWFSFGRTMQAYQSGMDPEWNKYGVGLLTIGLGIRETIASGHTFFDFLRGASDYKLKWAPVTCQNFTFRLFSRRPASIAVRLAFRAANAARPVVKALTRTILRYTPARASVERAD